MTSRKRPLPPRVPESLVARRVLVLAPHYDDEVLGCGGLILQLAAGGARVVCAFMSDGSGGAEGPPEGFTREQYSKRRRGEADKAAKVLGIDSVEHLGSRHGLSDGALTSSLDQLTSHIEALLQEHEPDLLLAPSPLEVTADHQATFRALHEALINRRRGRTDGGEPLSSQDDDSSPGDLALRVLCYEVNHPFYPDLLVDVTAELEGVADAMSRYRSQLERHDYMGACRGLRRYRALTVPDPCRYAEAYCQLTASDFTTRSPAQLVAYLGGAPSLVEVPSPRRVSIVVRTYNRPRRLAEALDSLAQSTYRNVEVVLVNDGGRRPEVAEDFPFPLRRVDLAANRGRAAAAQAGVEAATGDCVGFLDDDDLLAPEHLESLTAMLSGDVDVAYSDATVVCYEPTANGWRESGRRLPYSRDFDREILLLDNYIPFHTVLMTREALERAGAFDLQLPIFEDWDLLIRLSRSSSFVHLARTTCEYRHFLDGAADGPSGGHALGGAASARSDFEALKAKVLTKHAADLGPDALAGAVTRMRRQAVLAGDAARAQILKRQQDLERLQAREQELESSHGERGAEIARLQAREQELESSHGELGAEVERLQAREQELESSHGELGAEVERLQAREQELESSHGELGAEVERLQAREQELESSHGELGAEVERLQAREQELESSHGELGAEVERLQAREQELESSHGELGAEVERLQAREQELESSHGELGAEVERLQAREQELESSHGELGAEVERLQAREQELESSHGELGAEVERLQVRERKLESSHGELGAEVERLQAREQELESSHGELGAEVERLQAREQELESSHGELGAEVERLQAREQELESSHGELGAEVERLQAREQELESSHGETWRRGGAVAGSRAGSWSRRMVNLAPRWSGCRPVSRSWSRRMVNLAPRWSGCRFASGSWSRRMVNLAPRWSGCRFASGSWNRRIGNAAPRWSGCRFASGSWCRRIGSAKSKS